MFTVRIEGNCDEVGTVEYNLALGEHRAIQAKDYLTKLGVPPKRIKTVSYGSLLDTAVAAAYEVFDRNRITLARSEEEALPPLEVDPLLVSQAISNLLANAAQTMPAGGVVELSATRRVVLGRDEVAISVSDHGAGIAASDERMLFHPFFTTKPSGHGLGLAISQNIEVAMGVPCPSLSRVVVPGIVRPQVGVGHHDRRDRYVLAQDPISPAQDGVAWPDLQRQDQPRSAGGIEI